MSADEPPPVRRIYLTHFSHTDFGFTDLQSVCREMQVRYLDIAVDAVLASATGPADRRFCWTAESTVAVKDWWDAASPARREDFLRALRTGQFEVSALPFNQTPFLNARQWQTMLNWLPEDLWKRVQPTVAMQNDVNGFPRAGAVALLDRGIRHLFMGINSDSGGPPFYRPGAFWWKMPDGRRLFVWLNHSYPAGFDFFETYEWRRGPVPRAGDLLFRPPRGTDVFKTDEASLRSAHAQCRRRLEQLRQEGYPHDVLTISVTSQWRMDNDPPFPHLADFVAAWNTLGLKPELRLVTVSEAVRAMEAAIGAQVPEYSGEFTDWWANGTASAPREVAASRLAKRLLAAAESPLWGPMSPAAAGRADALYRDLCLFDEHTWGSSMSVALPWSLDARAQFAEKALFAYRPMAHAEWLLSQRARDRLLNEGEGWFIANPSAAPFSGWVRLNATSLRGDFKSLVFSDGSTRLPLLFEPGISPWHRPATPEDLTRENLAATHADNVPGRVAKFWLDNLPAQAVARCRPDAQAANSRPAVAGPVVTVDPYGWPNSARWPAMQGPLFLPGFGDFLAVQVNAFAPRWALLDIAYAGTAEERNRLRRERIVEVRAEPEGSAHVEESPHSLRYTQWLRHPRLRYASRTLELWKAEPRARLTLKLYRVSSNDPEILFAVFPLPAEGVLPQLSSGGMPFTPYTDQLPGSCRDYYAFDGWARYETPDGHWLWTSRDAPLLALGGPHIWARRTAPPADPHRVHAMLFNNCWHTNFAGDEHGAMEFQFDLVWRPGFSSVAEVQATADALCADPVVLINGPGTDDPFLRQRLFAP
ncbi:MAG: hypothetical protein IPM17_13195 [Verrucomicrobia bacterium]|nr:hypothetical protein [Verrucomicrobiota bacterium]